MFVNVGRFRFRPMSEEERASMLQRTEEDVRTVTEGSPGFRGLYAVRPSDDEVMMVWLWDAEADWEAALARLGPSLQEYVVPNLAQPPDRVGGEVVVQVTP
jgi:hypothetical protein